MAVINITEQNFEHEVMEADIPVLIDFYADWCAPCQAMMPIFTELSGEYKGKVKFVKVNTNVASHLSQAFGVQSIPTFAVINDKKELERWIGGASKDLLKSRVDEILKKLK